jgi:phage protein D
VSGEAPKAIWRVTLDGVDLTDRLKPRLMDVKVTSCRGDAADQLDLRLDDADGKLAIPPRGAVLRVWLGWEGEGLTDMGTFAVDEVEHAGSPDQLSLRGRSVQMKAAIRQLREHSYSGLTVGAIVEQLAGRNGLVPRCHASLAALTIDHIDQTHESDLNFLTRLGKKYDAIATIKAGSLLFSPIGQGQTPSGKPLPSVTIRRSSGDDHRWHEADRGSYSGVRAMYDRNTTGETASVLVGSDDGQGVKTLRHTYATKANAMRAARSEYQKMERGVSSFEMWLARGRPDIYPEMSVSVSGFKPQIDGTAWIVVKIEHVLAEQGLVSHASLEMGGGDSAIEEADVN